MAPLLSRLFSLRRSSIKCNSDFENSYLSQESWQSADFSMDQIRVLLFRECDWRGRKLLFDSKSIKVTFPAEASSQSSPSRMYAKLKKHYSNEPDKSSSLRPPKLGQDSHLSPNGTVYQYLRPLSDAKMLGEMIFGSVPMSYKGSTMKIHTTRSPSQLMLSEVFPQPTKPREYECNNLDDSCHLQSTQESSSRLFTLSESWKSSSVAHSLPVDVPEMAKIYHWKKEGDFAESFESASSNWNYPNSPDGYSSSNSSLTHSSSFSSLQRRWLRNRATSFENGWKRASDQEENGIREQRRIKLGVALVITLPDEKELGEKHFQEFFFMHISLIERHFKVLQANVAAAFLQRKDFVHQVMEALSTIRCVIYDLYKAPRLPSPVWLSFLSHGLQNQGICRKFIFEFSELIKECDTKNTKFFLSSLLTAVLTHHLSWVPTVTPPGVPNSHSYHQKHTAKWLDVLAKSHPYNPLGVQLEDLYGILGQPRKVTRTIVVGKRRELILKILFILTYFIRCSEIKECVEEIDPICDRNFNSVPQGRAPLIVADSVNICNTIKDQSLCESVQSNDLPVTLCKCHNSSDDITYQCRCHSDALMYNSSWQKKFKTLAGEKGVVLCLNLQPIQNNQNVESAFTGVDDVFISRTPDLDSGISEESAEDANNANTQASPPNYDNPCSVFPGPVMATHSSLNSHSVTEWKNEVFNADSSQKLKIEEVCDLKVEDSGLFESVLETVGNMCDVPTFKYAVDSPSDNGSAKSEDINTDGDSESASTEMANESLITSQQLDGCDSTDVANCTPPNCEKEKDCHLPIHKCENSVSEKQTTKNSPTTSCNVPGHLDCDLSVNYSEDEPRSDPRQIEFTSQMLKEYRTIRNEFHHNVSLFDKNCDENETDKAKDAELKICDAKFKFCTRSESITKSDLPKDCQQSCECFMCKNKNSTKEKFNFGEDCGNISCVEDFTLNHLAEMSFPRLKSHDSRTMKQCLGHSLYASYTDHYMPDFCLQGISETVPDSAITEDLANYVKHSNHESLSEAICIIANTDDWSVHVKSSNEIGVQIPSVPSQLVSSMAESLLQLSKLKIDPDFCLMHLEDRLQELYFKSILLKEYMCGWSKDKISIPEMSSTLGLDPSDIPLLSSVASTHCPPQIVPPSSPFYS